MPRYHPRQTFERVSAKWPERCTHCGAEQNAHYNGRCPLSDADLADNAVRLLDEIALQIDGRETDADTMSAIIEILTDAGYLIRDPNEMQEGK